MPAVLKFDGWRVVIYPNDHRPAHVHVIGSDGEAVFDLHCPGGPIELRENYHLDGKALHSIADALSVELGALCGAWKTIHENY